MRRLLIGAACLLLSVLACVRSQPEVIVITATFSAPPEPLQFATPDQAGLSPVPEVIAAVPTPDPTRPVTASDTGREYVIQPGDTLSAVAAAYGLSLNALLSVNNLPDPNSLFVGQVIVLPDPPDEQTSAFKIIPDSRLVRGPGSGLFNVHSFVAGQPGYIRNVVDLVENVPLTASQVVERVSLEYSVDARLLLALLEYRAGWLSQSEISEIGRIYPMEGQESPPGFDRRGLYRQLAWTANQLNRGYYGWKNRGLTTLEFGDGLRLLYAPGLNAGSVAVQYFLSQNTAYNTWSGQVNPDGFYRTYYAYFGDPFTGQIEPLVPAGLAQPEMVFPFSPGETWFFTGGHHGGWGSGSAWSALDFAPPDERPEGSSACYVSEYWATAVAPGIIARSGQGSVILDMDGDGDETTGWTVLYLHIATEDRIQAGTFVQAGDRIGRPSCEGGFSNATHMHIARRYNGEWMPVSCEACPPGGERPPFVMSGWVSVGYTNQEYQGYMTKGGERRIAEQGRLIPDNRVSR